MKSIFTTESIFRGAFSGSLTISMPCIS